MQGLICMSHRELTRLEILERIEDRRLNQTQAATMLGMTPRQMRRLVRSYRAQGPEGLVSRKRGKIGNHGGRKPSEITFWRLFVSNTPILGLRWPARSFWSATAC